MKQVTTSGPGLIIGIPTLGRPIPLQWALSFKSMHPPINYNINVMTVWGKPVADAREAIAEEALKCGHKYIFFLGDDVVCPPGIIKQLIFRMEQQPEIGVVGGIYCAKCDPSPPLVFRGNGQGSYWDWKVGEFFEITGIGMDATLIRASVLEKMSRPWFKTVQEDKFDDGINSADQWTEDLYFCEKLLKETDYKIYADGSLLCEHWDVYNNKYYSLPLNSLPMRRLSVERPKKAIDIGCGPVNRQDQFPDHELVRVDIREECNPDYRCNVTTLPFDNEEFDLVFSSHVLEHFPRNEWRNVLTEWIRILKTGGELMLVLPNIEWGIEHLKDQSTMKQALDVFYGAQTNDYDYHKVAFWPEFIQKELEQRKIREITIEHQGFNMIIRGRKGE